ncbi:hypothetical protein EJ08DRAFT_698874 [Tothia fuscella]|uniref:CFEM domain-containing protein n=1 Tax=Tothia fuscella TaxID=1048955 RepID=A0A9P4TXH9_9PEZI|nr:hypothetical protein EJ08DRAFT_698874 [Tothia fuscella]
MKVSTIVVFLAAFASARLSETSCASQCVNRLADGCDADDFACRCAKPGLVKQLLPCLQSACSSGSALNGKPCLFLHERSKINSHQEAKAAFSLECKAAGVKVNFASEAPTCVDMVRREDASPTAAVRAKGTGGTRASGARASGAYPTGTAKGVKPAAYTGAAVPREVTGGLLGFAAFAAAAAL